MDAGIDDDRTRAIVSVLVTLGPGEVTTYGDVADVAGHPRQSRLVGRILRLAGDESSPLPELPWWRVVNASGRLVPGHEREQAALLRAEDVLVRDGRVVSAPVGRFARSAPGVSRVGRRPRSTDPSRP